MMLEKQVSLRWVVVEKYKNEDVTYKARLVARGFEETIWTKYARIHQPVVKRTSRFYIITYSCK